MTDIYLALAAASITVLLTEATITERWRIWLNWKVLDCPFCMSWWIVSALCVLTQGIDLYQFIRIPALVCLTMAGVYVINKAMDSTYSEE